MLGTRRVEDVDAAVAAAEEIGYPVVLKSTAPWLRDRRDLGGMRFDLADAEDVRTAYAAIPAGDPVIVQQQAAPGVATVVQIVDDPSFGALVSFGVGGVATDLLGDRAYRTLPLTDLDASELVREPRAWPMLNGYRGSDPVDTDALEDMLLRVAQLGHRLALDLPHPFTGEAEALADLLERARLLAVQAEAHDHDVPLALVQRLQDVADVALHHLE